MNTPLSELYRWAGVLAVVAWLLFGVWNVWTLNTRVWVLEQNIQQIANVLNQARQGPQAQPKVVQAPKPEEAKKP